MSSEGDESGLLCDRDVELVDVAMGDGMPRLLFSSEAPKVEPGPIGLTRSCSEGLVVMC